MRNLILLILLLGTVSCASLTTSTLKKPYFWVAQKGNQKIYLYGTMHVGISINEVPSYALEKIQKSDLFLTEISGKRMHEMADTESSKKRRKKHLENYAKTINKKTRNPKKGRIPLKRIIPKKEWNTFERIFKKTKFGQSLLKKGIKPDGTDYYFASQILSEYSGDIYEKINNNLALGKLQMNRDFAWDLMEMNEEVPFDAALDKEIYDYAKKYKIKSNHLDKNRKLMNTIFDEMARLYFSKKLQDAEKIEKEYREAAIIYYNYKKKLVEFARSYRKGGDIDVMGRAKKVDFFSEIDDLILGQRNREWMVRILKHQKKYKNIYITVGAAHMFGKDSLLKKLKGHGYSVTRINKENQERF